MPPALQLGGQFAHALCRSNAKATRDRLAWSAAPTSPAQPAAPDLFRRPSCVLPPGRRIRPSGGATGCCNSANPWRMTWRETPVARDTADMPPRPQALLSAATNSRRERSSRTFFNRATRVLTAAPASIPSRIAQNNLKWKLYFLTNSNEHDVSGELCPVGQIEVESNHDPSDGGGQNHTLTIVEWFKLLLAELMISLTLFCLGSQEWPDNPLAWFLRNIFRPRLERWLSPSLDRWIVRKAAAKTDNSSFGPPSFNTFFKASSVSGATTSASGLSSVALDSLVGVPASS